MVFQEKKFTLETIKTTWFDFLDIEKIKGQDFDHQNCMPGYIHDKGREIPVAAPLSVGCVLRDQPPSPSGLLSTCCKCSIKAVYSIKLMLVPQPISGRITILNHQHIMMVKVMGKKVVGQL